MEVLVYQDSIRAKVHHRTISHFAFLSLLYGLFAVGNVVFHGDEVGQRSRLIAHRGDVHFEPVRRAVLMVVEDFHGYSLFSGDSSPKVPAGLSIRTWSL